MTGFQMISVDDQGAIKTTRSSFEIGRLEDLTKSVWDSATEPGMTFAPGFSYKLEDIQMGACPVQQPGQLNAFEDTTR